MRGETWVLTSPVTLLLSSDLVSAALSRGVSSHGGTWPEQRLESRPPPWPSKDFLFLEYPVTDSMLVLLLDLLPFIGD